MRIAMISTPYLQTPPTKYGGTERVVSMLTEEFVRIGHDVTLFASEGSKTTANLIEIWNDKQGVMKNIDFIRLLYKNIMKSGEFDIIHNNHNIVVDISTKKDIIPIITTMHNPIDNYNLKLSNKSDYICISKNQEFYAKKTGFNVLKSIYNPTDTDLYPYFPNQGTNLIFLGSISRVKGAHLAIDVAEKTGKKLLIAGPIFDDEYYQLKIKTRLNNNIEYIGEINDSDKIKLFSNALALLFPVQWEEPFGLVMTEAMACGIPVIGFNKGSIPEVVKDGETGFVVKDVIEMITAIDKIDLIDRNLCRKRIEEYFSVDRITKEYENLYNEIIYNSTRKIGELNDK